VKHTEVFRIHTKVQKKNKECPQGRHQRRESKAASLGPIHHHTNQQTRSKANKGLYWPATRSHQDFTGGEMVPSSVSGRAASVGATLARKQKTWRLLEAKN